MSTPEPSPRLSLDDLAALNDEICALAHAGIPLDLGLKVASSGLTRQVGDLAERLSERLATGVSLEDAVAAEGHAFPPVYRALVCTGIATGRLDQALASLSGFARSLEELRHRIGLALVYPLLVLLLAYGMWITFLLTLFPTFHTVLDDFGSAEGFMMKLLSTAARTLPLWAPAVPLAVLLIGVGWWVSGRWLLRATPEQSTWHPGYLAAAFLRWLPWLRTILANFHRANFTEMLGLLVEHDVPLPEAVPLAVDASGDPRLSGRRNAILQHLQSGGSLGQSLHATRATTPFIAWMIGAGEAHGGLAATLRQATSILRRRAEYQARWFQLVAPIVLLAVIGGGAVLVYCLSLFLPLANFLETLAAP